MKWIAISGSWRNVSQQVETDVRSDVREIMAQGNGIVSGGALGVDLIATDEALKSGSPNIHIILPTPLSVYAAHFRQRALEGVITADAAEILINQLEDVANLDGAKLTEMAGTACNEETYYARNDAVIAASDELLAYHVNGSAGVQNAIDTAHASHKPVFTRHYTL